MSLKANNPNFPTILPIKDKFFLPATNQEGLLAHAQLCIADNYNNATLVWTNIVNENYVLKHTQANSPNICLVQQVVFIFLRRLEFYMHCNTIGPELDNTFIIDIIIMWMWTILFCMQNSNVFIINCKTNKAQQVSLFTLALRISRFPIFILSVSPLIINDWKLTKRLL